MKKTIILAIVGLFAFAQAANAQFYVGGSFHINSSLAEERSTYIGFSPDLGYTVGKWCFGSILDLSVVDGSTAFTANPYVEYYFWESGPVSFFVEGGLMFRIYYSALSLSTFKTRAAKTCSKFAAGIAIIINLITDRDIHLDLLSSQSCQRACQGHCTRSRADCRYRVSVYSDNAGGIRTERAGFRRVNRDRLPDLKRK